MQNGYAPNSWNMYGNIALVLKEILRGARYIALSLRYFWGEIIKSFPGFIRGPIFTMVNRFDKFAEKVDRKTSNAAHHYLDPTIARESKSATSAKIIVREDASVVFAKTTYDNLKRIVGYLSSTMDIKEKFFISEMLCACAYRKSAHIFTDLEQDKAKAGLLNASIIRQGIIRTHISSNAAYSPVQKIRKLARISSFAHMLWLVVARDYLPEREEDLLYACCDLAYVIASQIEDAGEDYQKLDELLKAHAKII